MTERAWMIVAALCLLAAAAILWLRGVNDALFVVATLGVLAWFLSLRTRLKSSIVEPSDPQAEDEELEIENDSGVIDED